MNSSTNLRKPGKFVNAPVMKKDAMALVTGKPVYMDDVAPKDCLVVKVLRSPHAHALIKENDRFAYITKRIDRIIEKTVIRKIAMEDFCQLDLRLTQDKYRGSYERCAKVIERYSMQRGLDISELFIRLVFSFIVGNSDMHLKNFSLIESDEGSAQYHLSKAYDLLPVNIIMPEDKEEFALTMTGKKQNIRKKDFLIFAEAYGIPGNAAEKMIAKIVRMKPIFMQMCIDSYLPQYMKEQLNELIEKRCSVFKG